MVCKATTVCGPGVVLSEVRVCRGDGVVVVDEGVVAREVVRYVTDELGKYCDPSDTE